MATEQRQHATIPDAENVRDTVFVTVGGRDVQLPMADLGINIESSERQILDAVQGVINENLSDEHGEIAFTVRKATNTNNIYVFPKPVAGTTPEEFFNHCIQRQIDADRDYHKQSGRRFPERTIQRHTIGDFIRAVLCIDNEADAKTFFDGLVSHIESQIKAGTWKSKHGARESAEANIGWCFGEGMTSERIAMWRKATNALHPVFGARVPAPEEAVEMGMAMCETAKRGMTGG